MSTTRRVTLSVRRSWGRWVIPAAILVALLVGLWRLALQVGQSLAAQSIPFGFEFLQDVSGFQISESLIAFDDQSTVAQALLVGMLNTVKVSLPGIVAATTIGWMVGVGRISNNPLIRFYARLYVDCLRNIPLLLQVLAWYFVVTQTLPNNEHPAHWGDHVFLSQSGLFFPGYVWQEASGLWGWEWPDASGFRITGGWFVSPEFMALWLALSTYTGAYLAEIVRAGLASVSVGQRQAAMSLGLKPRDVVHAIVMPQAIRFMIPPGANQWLNLIKNSSLAVAVGYPDLMSVSNTTLNQTGRALECVLLTMAVYLLLSLITAVLAHWMNRRSLQWSEPDGLPLTVYQP